MSRRSKSNKKAPLDDVDVVDTMPWDPRTFVPDCVCMIVGPRGHGKSVFFEDLLSYIAPKLYMTMAMSPTNDSRLMFEKHMPFTLVYKNYDPDRIEEFMASMRDNCEWLCAEARQKGLAPESERERRIAALILDDCLGDKHALAAKSVSDVFMQGRHEDVCFITMMQYLVDMPKRLRGMLTYIMLTSTDDDETIAMLHRMFFRTKFTLSRFSSYFKQVTDNHTVLIIDRSSCKRNDKGEINGLGNVYNYKARYPAPQYSVCCATVWYCHYAKMINRAKLEQEKIKKLTEQSHAMFQIDQGEKRKKKKRGKSNTKELHRPRKTEIEKGEDDLLHGREREIVKRAAEYSSRTGHTFNIRDFTQMFGEMTGGKRSR